MAMDKRRATPCLSLRLVVWNAPLISYNLVAARNRSLNAACALACPALPHGFAERVEIRSRHSAISQLRSRCCNGGNGVNGQLGYSLLCRAPNPTTPSAWLTMVGNLMDDEVAT